MRNRLPSTRIPEEFLWLSEQVRPLSHWLLGSLLCITAGGLCSLVTPLVLKWLIDQVLPRRDAGRLVETVAVLFLAYEGRTLLTSLGAYLNLIAAQKLSLTLRMSVLRHLDLLSADYYEATPVGTAMYPLEDPIKEIAYFGSDLLPSILRMALTTCLTLGAMAMLSPILTFTVLPVIPIFLLSREYFRKKLSADSDSVQRNRVVWSNFLQEHLAAVIAIQLLRRQRRQERKAFCLLSTTIRSEQELFRTSIGFTVFTSFAVISAMSWVIGYGGWKVLFGTLTVGSLVAFYGFVIQMFEPLCGAAELYARAQRTFASIRQVRLVLGLCPAVTNSPGATVLQNGCSHALDLSGVEFGYHRQKHMIRIPSLQIPAGAHLAITGDNGAGKSTLAKLMARLYDVDAGAIRIGDHNVRNIELGSLRRCVGYLSRDPVLFDGSIDSNLRFVRPTASDHELQEMIARVGLSEWIASLTDGMGQAIGPGGCQLSGGQRQRLAIARALLERPRILILDEATSCLDSMSEDAVLCNVQRHLPNSTLIVISHRLSTIVQFGRVLVLSEGRIVFDGSPERYNFSAPAVPIFPLPWK
jgi:ABC-type bacteriocin/lantibiotic exporter with double-glycine peptidase domain